MCHKGTSRVAVSLVLMVVGTLAATAQTAPDWRKVGGASVGLALAAPATGPVDRVWFSGDGSVLYARTSSGRVFQTADFETWSQNANAPEPLLAAPAAAARLPEQGARVVAAAGLTRAYALGHQVYRSDDGGRSWINLTAYRSEAVIGFGQHDLAVSPANPDELVVANDFGVWRSMDGGLSWSGLNQFLPNLAVRRILSTPAASAGTRLVADRLGVLELPPGGTVWLPARGAGLDAEAALAERISSAVPGEISAVASSSDMVYAGTADGRIYVSVDGGQTFRLVREAAGSRVERIFADAAEPWVALVALSGRGPHVLHTTNSGNQWYPLDGNLPDAAAHGVTAERASGAVYVATDKGIFWTRADLENPSPNAVNWTSLSDRLPAAPAIDVRLDAASVQLYAALDGYGVYAAAAPHRLSDVRIVNAADFSARPAAPGSLLSVIGGRVNPARGANLDYPVLAVVGNDSQIQVPFEAEGSNVALALQTTRGTVVRDVALRRVSPAILVGSDGAAMLWDADSGLAVDARNAAHSNGRIQIWATGLGRVRPDWPTGLAAPLENPPAVAASVKVYLDRVPLEVTRATLLPGYIGFYLIEAQLPSINNLGTSELYISADGQDSNRIQIVIEP